MNNTMTDDDYMWECIELSKLALENGDPPVGAILVIGDLIIGKGIESGRSTNDITNHAEILSIKDAIANDNGSILKHATMYTTHEPCIMCSYVIRHHKIPRIVYGTNVDQIGGHTSGFGILNTEEVTNWGKPPEVTSGVCKSRCEQLTKQFINQLKNEKS